MTENMTENMTPKDHENPPIQSKTRSTTGRGLKRKRTATTPIAKKLVKKKLAYSEPESHPLFASKPETAQPGTSKSIKPVSESVSLKKAEKSSPELATTFDDDSDFEVYSKYNQKLPYTFKEDELILKFVLKGQNIFRVSSLSLWKQLEIRKDKPKRTYQSLKNRFLRNIRPYLFTTYKHLIKDRDTVNRILIKFPELKMQMGVRDLLNVKVPEVFKTTGDDIKKDPNRSEFEAYFEGIPELMMPTPDDLFGSPTSASLFVKLPKISKSKRTIRLYENIITVSVDSSNSEDLDNVLSSFVGLNERFKKLIKTKERVSCPTCGRFYRRPVANDSSGSDLESDILIPDSVDSMKNFDSTNAYSSSKKKEKDINQKMMSCAEFSSNSPCSQNLLMSLEKFSTSDGGLDESNEALEGDYVKEEDEINDAFEVDEVPLCDIKSEADDRSTENDSDIDLIYENTVARFQKLINDDEEKTLQRTCLHRNRDSIGFNANSEKNLDSFFLDSSPELETPALTNSYSTQVQSDNFSNVKLSQKKIKSTQPQRKTRSSLASNMMLMLAQKTDIKKN